MLASKSLLTILLFPLLTFAANTPLYECSSKTNESLKIWESKVDGLVQYNVETLLGKDKKKKAFNLGSSRQVKDTNVRRFESYLKMSFTEKDSQNKKYQIVIDGNGQLNQKNHTAKLTVTDAKNREQVSQFNCKIKQEKL